MLQFLINTLHIYIIAFTKCFFILLYIVCKRYGFKIKQRKDFGENIA